MSTRTISIPGARAPASSRWRSLVTQESVATLIVSLVVGAAVIVPLVVLFISSFLVLDDFGFDTEWGLDNYVTLFTDRVIPKAFVNTLWISSGTTILATFLGVSLAWINARTNCPWRDKLEPFNSDSVLSEPVRRRHRVAQSRRAQDRPAQQLGARSIRHRGPHSQRRQYIRRDLGDRHLLRAPGLSVRRRLAQADGSLARGLGADHRRRAVSHHPDGDAAARRAGYPVGRDHRFS